MKRGTLEGILRSRKSERPWIYGLGLATGILAGLVVVGYRLAAARLDELRGLLFRGPEDWRLSRLLAWLGLTVLAGAATALMVRRSPLIKGSGIPQVKAALMRRLGLDWRRELPLKFAGGSLALGAGLSLGREGPSIQLGALVGAGLCDLSRRSELKRYLITAGSAAGISAAFNAPLAGVLFCLEELHRCVSPVMLGSAMIAAVASNAVSWLLLGGDSVFAIDLAGILPLSLYPHILAVGLASGLSGALFNASLLRSQALFRRAVPKEGARIAFAFALGGLVAVAAPTLAGGGHLLVDRVARGELPILALAALFLGKSLFTFFSYGSGAPGGIFLPMLAIGAALGGIMNEALGALGMVGGYAGNFVILGMVGFFAAVVRAPITGAVLITEMSGSFAHFPALILVSVVASLLASLLRSKPIYDSLLAQLAPIGARETEEGAAILHIPVLEGSALVGAAEAQTSLPPACLLIAVQRGESELFPRPGLDILPGDLLQVLVPAEEARSAKHRLLELASRPRPESPESEE